MISPQPPTPFDLGLRSIILRPTSGSGSLRPETSWPTWCASLNAADDTSIKAPIGRLRKRGEERPRRVELVVGAGERTRQSCGITWELELVDVVCVEMDIEGWVLIKTSCQPVSFLYHWNQHMNGAIVRRRWHESRTWRMWIGSASKNSCAMSIVYCAGLCGTSEIEWWNWKSIFRFEDSRVCAWIARRAWLVSTRWTSMRPCEGNSRDKT